ncbi:MAG: hypothetical protein LUG45_02070 [Clostridiales bacterium]|nr:hypothetical protein [Clostridiales bacterium]
MKKESLWEKRGLEWKTGLVCLALAAVALVFFALSYTTGYYNFGEMHSTVTLGLLIGLIAVEVLLVLGYQRFGHTLVYQILTFAVTAMLALAVGLLMADRVEGIGNCIVTDYDSGHGKEEAIYLSFASTAALTLGIFSNIIGSFSPKKSNAVRSLLN